jgi:hypothetical protein
MYLKAKNSRNSKIQKANHNSYETKMFIRGEDILLKPHFRKNILRQVIRKKYAWESRISCVSCLVASVLAEVIFSPGQSRFLCTGARYSQYSSLPTHVTEKIDVGLCVS